MMLAALVVAACTHSVEGTGENKGGGTGGGGTDNLLGDTKKTEDGKQPLGNDTNPTKPANGETCSLETGSATCNACAAKSCCTEIDACNGNQACASLWSCLMKCGEDNACGQDCVQTYPEGREGVSALVDCGNAYCATECE